MAAGWGDQLDRFWNLLYLLVADTPKRETTGIPFITVFSWIIKTCRDAAQNLYCRKHTHVRVRTECFTTEFPPDWASWKAVLTLTGLSWLNKVNKMNTHCSLLAEGIGVPEGFLQGMKSRHQAVTQLQSETDGETTSVTNPRTHYGPISLSVNLVCVCFTWLVWLALWQCHSRHFQLLVVTLTGCWGRLFLTGRCIAAWWSQSF